MTLERQEREEFVQQPLFKLARLSEADRQGSTIRVEFKGPFSWYGAADAPAIDRAQECHSKGIYLYAVKLADGYLVRYVGITERSFLVRLRDHRRRAFGGWYEVREAESYARGEYRLLWPGKYGSNGKSYAEIVEHGSGLQEAVEKEHRVERLFVASMDCDRRTMERIEAALMMRLESAAEKRVCSFLTPGVKRIKRRFDEVPFAYTISSPAPILGFPKELSA